MRMKQSQLTKIDDNIYKYDEMQWIMYTMNGMIYDVGMRHCLQSITINRTFHAEISTSSKN